MSKNMYKFPSFCFVCVVEIRLLLQLLQEAWYTLFLVLSLSTIKKMFRTELIQITWPHIIL